MTVEADSARVKLTTPLTKATYTPEVRFRYEKGPILPEEEGGILIKMCVFRVEPQMGDRFVFSADVLGTLELLVLRSTI